MLCVVLGLRESVVAAILREQSVIENCEKAMSVMSVCESKEKTREIFL